ncbi:hypothetical protein M0R19_03780 [Candidatus Pacearchaeota archaeon]|nr:hypothetical protein [Candidatus Pacearchaeota archaeon]
MVLTGKIYTYKPSENDVYFHLEIDKNWFINNILPNLLLCYKCNTENSCLFLYNCEFKSFYCVPLVSQEKFKLIENNIVG